MKILWTICGRAGSKGIKNKNIKSFLGKPLPYYTISAIDLYLKKHVDVEYDIVVSSDSSELLKLMNDNKMRKVDLIDRSAELSGDTISKIAVIRNCYEIMTKNKNIEYDMVVDLDITSPLRKVCDIENLINTQINKKTELTTSVVPARRNPYFNQVMRNGECGIKKVIESNFTARQQAPEIFDMNASLYAYSIDFIKSDKNLFDGYSEMIEMQDTAVLDLDHENDFVLMEVIAKYLFENDEKYKEISDNIK